MAELSGPRRIAMKLEGQIAELEAQRATVAKADRKVINRKLHMHRELLRWCKTRAGY